MAKSQNYLRGIALMLLADICFAIMAAFTKTIGSGIPAIQIVFIRSGVTTLALLPIMSQRHISLLGKNPLTLWARGLIGYVALQLYFWALPQMHLGTAIMLNYTAPIYAVLIAYLFLKDRASRLGQVCLLGSFVGVFILTAPEIPIAPAPVLAAAASGLLAGMVHLLIRYSHEDESPLTIIFYFTAVSTMASGILLCLLGWVSMAPSDWIGVGLVTLTALLGQLGLTTSLRTAPVSVVSPYGYLTPVFGLLLGWFFWQESIPATAMIGSAMIIAFGVLMFRENRRAHLAIRYPGNPGG